MTFIDRIRAILDSAPPAPGPGCYPPVDGWDGVAAPRVFFPGDTVPAGTHITTLSTLHGETQVHVLDALIREDWIVDTKCPFVELAVPSPEEWQATVYRAKAEREADRG